MVMKLIVMIKKLIIKKCQSDEGGCDDNVYNVDDNKSNVMCFLYGFLE